MENEVEEFIRENNESRSADDSSSVDENGWWPHHLQPIVNKQFLINYEREVNKVLNKDH